jgi:hypothetical protein
MSDALTQLRNKGEVPWDDIIDETRSLEDYTGNATIRDWMLEALPVAKLDPWQGRIPLILCESRSLAGVLRAMCRDYRVRVAPTNGQCAGFLHTEVAPRLRPDDDVLYFGDRDLCGDDIEGNNRRVLEREVGPLRWERLALTDVQIEIHNLPRIIKTDHRFKNGGTHEAVETEALSQRIIVEILRNRLDELIPEPLERVHEREQRQREIIRELLSPD